MNTMIQKSANFYLSTGSYIQYISKGKQYACLIRQDNMAHNPLEEDGHLGNIICWSHWYKGFNPYETAVDCFYDLAAQYVSLSQVRQQVTKGKTNLQLRHTEDTISLISTSWYAKGRTILSAPTEDGIFAEENKVRIVNAMDKGLSQLVKECQELVILPLYLFDRPGISVSTRKFHDVCDSGIIGWVYTDKKAVEKHLGMKIANQTNWKKQAIAVLQQEVKHYDQYLANNMYGYTLYELDPDTEAWEEAGKYGWGFYGLNVVESGLAEAVLGLKEAIQSRRFFLGAAQNQQTMIPVWKFPGITMKGKAYQKAMLPVHA